MTADNEAVQEGFPVFCVTAYVALCFCSFDLRTTRVDFVECLMRFLPTEAEMKLLRQYERDRKPLEALSDEDRFMMQFSRIERLNQRMSIMIFMGNFTDNVQMLTPVRLSQTCRNLPLPAAAMWHLYLWKD